MFAPHVGTKFQMSCGNSQTLELELQSVNDLGSSARNIQFSMVFLGPQNAPIEQMIYRLEHPALGPLDLFLVPIGRGQNGVQYEAIVNRSIDRRHLSTLAHFHVGTFSRWRWQVGRLAGWQVSPPATRCAAGQLATCQPATIPTNPPPVLPAAGSASRRRGGSRGRC